MITLLMAHLVFAILVSKLNCIRKSTRENCVWPPQVRTAQGCGLIKNTRSLKVANHEIVHAGHLSLNEKSNKNVSFASHHPKAKVSYLWHPPTSRTKP